MSRKILVTGGTGYVGSALVPALAESYPVRVLDTMAFGNSIEGVPNVEHMQGDIQDIRDVRKALEGVTDVVWLAGIVTDDLVDMNVDKARRINVGALAYALGACREAQIDRFILMSSSSVYGTTEGPATEDTEPQPMTEYAQTKLDQEKALWPWQKFFTCAAIRSATLCGPAPRMRLDTILNAMSADAYYKGTICVHGGQQWRSNLNVKEMVAIYKLLLEAPPEKIQGQVFNATSGNHTALELADMIQGRASEFRDGGAEVEVQRSRQDSRHYKMSAEKLIATLGWTPKHGIEDAIDSNFRFFAEGGIENWESDLWYNTRRMADFMKKEDTHGVVGDSRTT